ncbi:MBG domain-containing protein [Salinivirga cyanobacteriivorans]
MKNLLVLLGLCFLFTNSYSQFEKLKSDSIYTVYNGIADWGDFDRDGDLDLIVSAYMYESINRNATIIYRNEGNFNFVVHTDTLVGVQRGSVEWGDFNNDGYLDIYVGGYNTSFINKIYRNNQDGSFSELEMDYSDIAGPGGWGDYNSDGLLDIYFGGTLYQNMGNEDFIPMDYNIECELFIKWGDYDNDGDLDILTQNSIYKNNGNNFEKITYDNSKYSIHDWGDYDNDGDLDIISLGYYSNTRIYKNNGNDSFEEITTTSFPNYYEGSGCWGDLNNDGNLDLILTGSLTSSQSSTNVYINNGNNDFTALNDTLFYQVKDSKVNIADINNDNKLDFITIPYKYNYTDKAVKIYKNTTPNINTPPVAPSNTFAQTNGNNVTLKWNSVTTDETEKNSLMYNIAFGQSISNLNTIRPNSLSDGKRIIVDRGNAERDTTFSIKNLSRGMHYFKIQTIDNSFQSGAFSEIDSIEITELGPAFDLVVDSNYCTEIYMSWSRGNGDKCLVFMKEDSATTANLTDSITYAANSVFGDGDQIDNSGWFCVYNGSDNTAKIEGLKPNSNYTIKVIEYYGSPGEETYCNQTANNNPFQFKTLLFRIERINTTNAFPSWCDFDNDNDLDMFLGPDIYKKEGDQYTKMENAIENGYQYNFGDYNNDGFTDALVVTKDYPDFNVKLYKNNAGASFTIDENLNLTNFNNYNRASWADIDNDGDLDFLHTGTSQSKMYINKGDGTFFIDESIDNIPIFKCARTIWIDIDNDNDLDLYIYENGEDTYYLSSIKSAFFENNGNGSFTEKDIIPNTHNWNIDFGDYNNDGFIDLLAISDNRSAIFKNNGNNQFTETNILQIGNYKKGNAMWADINNDNNLDIIIAGYENNKKRTQIFLQENDSLFYEFTNHDLINVSHASFAFVDFDNDSDLDFAINGNVNVFHDVYIYENTTLKTKEHLEAPTNLRTKIIGTDVLLSWDSVFNDSNHYKSIPYNVVIGESIDAIDVISPNASIPDGFRRIPTNGNAWLDTAFLLKNAPFGKNYWRVQAINSSYKGGPFSVIDSFFVNTVIQASNVVLNGATPYTSNIKWKRGNADSCIVFITKDTASQLSLVNGNNYEANNTYGLGSEVNSEWYCLYKGVSDSLHINGLSPFTDYKIQVVEYDRVNNEEFYAINDYKQSELFILTPLYDTIVRDSIYMEANAIETTLIKPVDFNNDGLMDFIATNDSLMVFYNNGTTFTKQFSIQLTDKSHIEVACRDFNNDGKIDILSNDGKIFINEGNDSLTIINPFTEDKIGTTFTSVHWLDYDNDGDIDALLSESSEGDNYNLATIYRNEGNLLFSPRFIFDKMGGNTVAWGDFDNDSYKDIAISKPNSSILIYKNNNGEGFTLKKTISFSTYPQNFSSFEWADYDNDGDIDLLTSGSENGTCKTYIIENDGNANFQKISIPELSNLSGILNIQWLDYDNDGDFDVCVSKSSEYLHRGVSDIYRNIGNRNFELHPYCFPDESLNIYNIDYDNDNNLDIISVNRKPVGYGHHVYITTRKNLLPNSNLKPSIPENLYDTVINSKTYLSWQPSSDAETNYESLTYNLMIGRTIEGIETISPNSNIVSGSRQVLSIGTAGQDTSFVLGNAMVGTHYWKVQAIDNQYSASQFSEVDSFKIVNLTAANNITVKNIGTSKVNFSWSRGNGNKRAVFIKEGHHEFITLDNDSIYIPNAKFGHGSQLRQTGWYCVSNGDQSSAIISNLKADTDYTIMVIEYNDLFAGKVTYCKNAGTNNPYEITTTKFHKLTSVPVGKDKDLKWVDMDNDGDLDVMVYGRISGWDCKFLKNEDSVFTEITFDPLHELKYSLGDSEVADLDNDGDLDIITTGRLSSNRETNVYINEGDFVFTKINNHGMLGLSEGAMDCGDYDNDGDIDIIITGSQGYPRNTFLYTNNGDLTFTENTNTEFSGTKYGEIKFVDFNNDGYLDVFITGSFMNYSDSKLYLNQGNQTFIENTNFVVRSVTDGDASWGDLNNDGYPDLVLTGYVFNSHYSIAAYINNGGSTVSDYIITSPCDEGTSCDLADFNNDGYLDIIETGEKFFTASPSESLYSTNVYINNKSNGFYRKNMGIVDVGNGDARWGDFDNDGDLDIAIVGNMEEYKDSLYIYRNDIQDLNSISSKPSNLSASFHGDSLLIQWESALDESTPANALTYNLSIYKAGDTLFSISPNTLSDSLNPKHKRLIVESGRNGLENQIVLNDFDPQEEYKIRLQAIDAAKSGGYFSDEISSKNMNDSILFVCPSVKNYGDSAFALNAVANSNLEVQFKSSDSTILLIRNDSAFINKAGVVYISAFHEGNDTINPTEKINKLTILKAPLTITPISVMKELGEVLPLLEVNYSGFLNGDNEDDLDQLPNIICEANELSTLGEYPITVNEAYDDCYYFDYETGTVTVTKKLLTVSVLNETKSYGSPNPQFTLVYDGFYAEEDESDLDELPTISTTATELSDVGTYPIEITGGYDLNYTFIRENGELEITKAPLHVTINDTSKLYGEPNPDFIIEYTGLILESHINEIDVQPTIQCDADIYDNAGTLHDISISGGSDNNYDFQSYTNGVLAIQKAPLNITADNLVKNYGDSIPDLTMSFNGFVNSEDFSVLDDLPEISTTATMESSSGIYPINLTDGLDNNYSYNLNNGELTITKSIIEVAVLDTTKTYGDPNPEFKLTYAGFKNNDTITDLDTIPAINCLADEQSNSGIYTISVADGFDNNYEFNYINGELEIVKAPVSVSVLDTSKTYGQSNPEFTLNYTGLMAWDNETTIEIAPQIICLSDEFDEAGTTHDILISGGNDNNYYFDSYENGILSINKTSLTISAEDKNSTYGTEIPDFTLSFEGFVNNESEAVLDTLPNINCDATITSNSGTYPIELSNGLDNNYNYNLLNGELFITKAPLEIIGLDTMKIYGQVNPQFELEYAGFVNNDTISDIDQQPTIDCNAGQFSDVGTYAIVPSAGFDDNYEMEYINGLLAVEKAKLIVNARDTSRVYGETNPEFTLEYQGFINQDTEADLDVIPNTTCIADINSNVGTYDIEVNNGDDNNYWFEYINGILTIIKAEQTIEFPAIPTCYLTDTLYEPEAYASSGLPIEYISSDTTIAVVRNNLIYFVSIGSTDITATQEGNENYNAATSITRAMIIDSTNSIAGLIGLKKRIYPNPTNRFVNLVNFDINERFTIINQYGSIIYRDAIQNLNYKIDLGHLPKGVYIIKTEGEYKSDYKIIIY